MADIVTGVVRLTLGGVLVVFFGYFLVRSAFDKKTRLEFLSLPSRPRPPSVRDQVLAAIMCAVGIATGAVIVSSGYDVLIAP